MARTGGGEGRGLDGAVPPCGPRRGLWLFLGVRLELDVHVNICVYLFNLERCQLGTSQSHDGDSKGIRVGCVDHISLEPHIYSFHCFLMKE